MPSESPRFWLKFFLTFRDLSPVEKNGEADPYVSVKLIPVNGATSKVIKRKTAIVQKTLNPYFDSQ